MAPQLKTMGCTCVPGMNLPSPDDVVLIIAKDVCFLTSKLFFLTPPTKVWAQQRDRPRAGASTTNTWHHVPYVRGLDIFHRPARNRLNVLCVAGMKIEYWKKTASTVPSESHFPTYAPRTGVKNSPTWDVLSYYSCIVGINIARHAVRNSGQ